MSYGLPEQYDKALLIYLNGLHAPWLDPIMLLMTQALFWTPLYLLLIFLLFVWASLMTWTRIYPGVHFPTDILTGIILGFCSGAIGIATSHYLLAWYVRKNATQHTDL